MTLRTRQLKRSPQLRRLLRQARGRLHDKLALLDSEWGAARLHEPRPALRAPHHREFELAHALRFANSLNALEGVYRVRLQPDGQKLQWVGTGDERNEVLDDEPDSSLLTRLQPLLLSWFVPTDQL